MSDRRRTRKPYSSGLWIDFNGNHIGISVDSVHATLSDCRDVRAARRTARAVVRALGWPGRAVRTVAGWVSMCAPYGFARHHVPRRVGPARAAMPALEWTDVLGCPAPAPAAKRTRRLPRHLRPKT